MIKWADYLISEVSYTADHLISVAIRHKDTDQGITKGKPVDRLTIASDIKNGLLYITIYNQKNSWKKGHKIRTFSIGGTPYLRIDQNKVKLDFLGDIPESSIIVSTQIQALQTKSSQVEPLSSPRGSLPKESTEELPQELDLAPEPIESEEEATPEQLTQLNDLQQQIDELEDILSSQILPESQSEEEATPEQLTQLNDLQQQIDELENILSTKLHSSFDDPTQEQFSKIEKLEKEIKQLEDANIEHKIIKTLHKQNKKLDDIERKLHNSESSNIPSDLVESYCLKCKTKRKIENVEETVMKNGRPALRGICSVCNRKVFRIVKMKK